MKEYRPHTHTYICTLNWTGQTWLDLHNFFFTMRLSKHSSRSSLPLRGFYAPYKHGLRLGVLSNLGRVSSEDQQTKTNTHDGKKISTRNDLQNVSAWKRIRNFRTGRPTHSNTLYKYSKMFISLVITAMIVHFLLFIYSVIRSVCCNSKRSIIAIRPPEYAYTRTLHR